MKKLNAAVALLALGMASSPWVMAESAPQAASVDEHKTASETSATAKASTDQAVQDARKAQEEKRKLVNQSVLDAFNKIEEAVEFLGEDGKEKKAIEALQVATGKFDTALTADPKLDLVPIDVSVTVAELLSGPKVIKGQTEMAIDLLEKNKVQAARLLLIPMVDEIVTSTTYLPMKTYPDAIKLATKELIDGKKEQAIETLADALTTVVSETQIIPLGLIRAENYVKEASKMDMEKDKAQIKEYLTKAETELEISRLLGYTDKHSSEYEDLKAQLKNLEKEVKKGHSVKKLYEKLEGSITSLIGKHEADQQSASKEESK